VSDKAGYGGGITTNDEHRMEFSWPIIILTIAVGAVQLAVGVALGRLLPLGHAKPDEPVEVPEEAPDLLDANRLQSWVATLRRLVDTVVGDVGRHQTRIEQITKDLATLRQRNQDRAGDSLMLRIGEIERANRHFEQRLAHTEDALREQARQISDHVAQTSLAGDAELQDICRELRARMAELTP